MKRFFSTFCLIAFTLSLTAQQSKSLIRPFKPDFSTDIIYVDLDADGDPDLIKSFINDTIPICWIDDDDDMKTGDVEGDLDSDCLLVDRNGDGIFAGPCDLSVDWVDNNTDGIADMQLLVENSNPLITNYWEWSSNYMWIIDTEQDQQFHYLNWETIVLRAWEHSGSSNFYEDYHGQTLFQKVHIPSYRFGDLRYSWENPFLFYDKDDDGLTEVAIRLEDSCEFDKEKSDDYKKVDTHPTGMIDHAYLSFDLDNDNGPANEFDFDMSVFFSGKGFSYVDQVHEFENMPGLPEADSLFFDNRWRKLDELIYTDHDSAWTFVFDKGIWDQCWFVFDEDDDCERWERVEFYQPKNPFIMGMNEGGIDNNPQSDASGDRGEWDMDNSGNGNFYIGFDGKIHLYGAEKGYWRVDQDAWSYQGWGGLYEDKYARDQKEPEKFPTIAYEDTDGDGFFNQISFDLDGDTVFEEAYNLLDFGLKTDYILFKTSEMDYEDLNEMFLSSTEMNWQNALKAVEAAKSLGVNYKWYARFLYPKSLNEKYQYAWWLQYYLFADFLELAENEMDNGFKENVIHAFLSGEWEHLVR